jgi:hypothetical protein
MRRGPRKKTKFLDANYLIGTTHGLAIANN